MQEITHLCVHSSYSFLGGAASVEELVERAAQDSLTGLALTDVNALYGVVAFSHACQEQNIKPIVGMTVTVALPEVIGYEKFRGQPPGELVLLARNTEGYHSLCHLSSLIQAHPDREVRAARGLGLADLKAHTQGLLCLSGGRRGWLDRALKAGDGQAAYRFASRLAILYGSDNVYLSLELHRHEDYPIAREISALAQRLGLLTAAVQPVYCLSPEDAPLLNLLTAIQHNCTLKDCLDQNLPDGGQEGISLHWLSPEEMNRRFDAFPDALANTAQVVARCESALPERRRLWPALSLEDRQTPDQALTELALRGMLERYGENPDTAIRERLERELDAIQRYGFAPFFLVVADVARYARETEIPISSRGSVANSLVAYCTGVTNVDPIEHDLLFERFLSPGRADIPDIDIDFCSRRRDEVLDYVRKKYGEDKVSLVGTVSTMRARSAVRETAKAYGLNTDQINQLVKNLPRWTHPDPRRRDTRSTREIIGELGDPIQEQIVEQASRIVGLPHHMGVHPGAVVITPEPLVDLLPLQWATKGFLITQYDFRDIEAIGLPKLDLLGVSALTVLADAAVLVRKYHEPGFDLESIPLDDSLTSDLLCRSDTIGVFQCESQGARSTLNKLKARSVRDLAVANAFFKPGPSTGGMARSFVRRYRGEEEVQYLHPALAPILGTTKGVLIFQEQILRVAREIAGLSWQQAGFLRRGMSKMKREEMAQIEEDFIQGCQRPEPDGPGLSPDQAEELWSQVAAFSGYGFNQGHATAYAAVSYRMAYLKGHWPAEFLCARLGNWGGFHHPAVYMVEAMRLGIAIRPPHINASLSRFTLDWEGEKPVLWMGLGQVRDLRHSVVRMIVEQREKLPFTGLRDLLQRVSLQKKEITHLIQCGALDGLGESRSALLVQAEELSRAENVLQLSLFEVDNTGRKPPETETLAQRAEWEQKLLGYPVSIMQDPLRQVTARLPRHLSLKQVAQQKRKQVLTAAVRVPGRTGGDGYYLWDGEEWLIANPPKGARFPDPWKPLIVKGHWREDEWGFGWLQVEEMEVL